MVLGKDVFDARGGLLGAVVDVGVHDHRRVKFLLVSAESEPTTADADRARRFERLSVDLIDTVGLNGVVLKRLPA